MSLTSNFVPTANTFSSNYRNSSDLNSNSSTPANPQTNQTVLKRSSPVHASHSDLRTSGPLAKRPASQTNRESNETSTTNNPKTTSELPACLKKLVRSIVRTFYSREHSLIVDMLVRNTIMKEDDLCERLRFEKKQLGQYLHTLKADQFIKSKLQLETDADGKTTRITHYFIDYKLFVNVVKYRLDQMQRRLETEQRQSTSRATFKCSSCNTNYTDLEVDRLMDFMNPGKLVCVYCRADVVEEEDNVSRTDARALIAKFHQQVRDPIDNMLRECDEIHLSQAILEPEIRPLEPLFDEQDNGIIHQIKKEDESKDFIGPNDNRRNATLFGPTESSVRIVLSGSLDKLSQVVKERPVWMASSTITPDPLGSIGDIDRSGSQSANAGESNSSSSNTSVDHVTQTLTPGRVPYGFTGSSATGTGSSNTSDSNAQGGSGVSSGSADIMQLLLVHERRGNANQQPSKTPASSARNTNIPKPHSAISTRDSVDGTKSPDKEQIKQPMYTIKIGDRLMKYSEITPAIVKTMTPEERAEYVRIGKQIYMNVMVD